MFTETIPGFRHRDRCGGCTIEETEACSEAAIAADTDLRLGENGALQSPPRFAEAVSLRSGGEKCILRFERMEIGRCGLSGRYCPKLVTP